VLNSKIFRRPVVVSSAAGTALILVLWHLTGEGAALLALAFALAGVVASLVLARREIVEGEEVDRPVHAHQLRRGLLLGGVCSVASLVALFSIDPSRSGVQLFAPVFFFVLFGLLAARWLYGAIWIHRRLH